jgi:hypothetical protein
MLVATVPPGAKPGDKIPIIHPSTGQYFEVAVPQGLVAGDTFPFITAPVAVAQVVQPVQSARPPHPQQRQAPAEVHIHHYHDHAGPSGGPSGMVIDRSDPEYIDAADVAGCWFNLTVCGCFPGCEQYEALSPDELKTGECLCCLGLLPACGDVYPIWSRVGPRIFVHPDLGEMHFNGPDRILDAVACKLCSC